MAFFGLTYVGPQNSFKHHDLFKNDYHNSLKPHFPEGMPGPLGNVIFDDDPVDEREIFEDDAAYWLLKEAMKKRPAKASYVSNKQFVEDKVSKHVRKPEEQFQKWNQPITSSMEYGWPKLGGKFGGMVVNANLAAERASARPRKTFPINSSPETRFQEQLLKANKTL
jgi:hypothetical protein